MRKLLLSTVAATAILSSAALAADLPVRAPALAPAPVFVAMNWSGFYVGVSGGYGGNKFEYPALVTNPGGPIPNINANANITSGGFLVGGTVGYNYQFSSSLVVGVEADWSWAQIDGRVGLGLNVPGFVNAGINAGSTIDNLGTARVRLGYAFDRALLYVTGGWAWGNVNSGVNGAIAIGGGAPLGFGLSRDNSVNGYVVGAGLEYMLTNNLSFKTEYLFADLGKATLWNRTYAGIGPGGTDITADLKVKTNIHVVRAGLNYRFNWGSSAPVVAKY